MHNIAERVARLERAIAVRAHVGVLLVRYGSDDVPALIERMVVDGRAVGSLIVLPADEPDAGIWERKAVANARAARVKYPTAPKPAR